MALIEPTILDISSQSGPYDLSVLAMYYKNILQMCIHHISASIFMLMFYKMRFDHLVGLMESSPI